MTEEKKKLKVAVFGAGGIGKEVVRQLYEDYPADEIEVVLVNRSQANLGEAIREVTKQLDEGFERPASLDSEVANHIRGSDANSNRGHLPKINISTLLQENALHGAKGVKKQLEGIDAVLVTTGAQRKEGASRDSVVFENLGIVEDAAAITSRYCPTVPVIMSTNQVDLMATRYCDIYREKGLDTDKIFALGGELDEARCRIAISETLNKTLATNVDPKNVDVRIYGQHGGFMAIDLSATTVDGVNLKEFVESRGGKYDDVGKAIIEATKNYSERTIQDYKLNHAGGRTAFVSPASAMIKMLGVILNGGEMSAIMFDKNKETVLPFATGHRVVIGNNGEVLEVKYPDTQTPVQQDLAKSNMAVGSGVQKLEAYIELQKLVSEDRIFKSKNQVAEGSIGFDAPIKARSYKDPLNIMQQKGWKIENNSGRVSISLPESASEFDKAMFDALKAMFESKLKEAPAKGIAA